jgi:hypothetical protein
MKLKISLFCLLMFCVAGAAQAADAIDTLKGNPLDGLFLLRDGRSMRSSSSDKNWDTGNADNSLFFSNSEIVLADLQGPGIITHIWITTGCRDRNYPRLLALRVYYDGDKQPSVEAPLGDFFAVGHGFDVPVNSLPIQVSSEGRARNSFWPMPFRKSVRITVTNENNFSSGGIIYWYVDWIKVDALPENTGYFHAQYRQEYPPKPGRYLLADIKGRGQYVGTVISWLANMPSWIGEGDDFFYIDGEQTPSLRGTGTEDYFGDAWGFRQFNQPYHGVSVWEGDHTGAHTTAYRWHIADPILFGKSLRAEIEHVGPVFNNDGTMKTGYGERSDHMSSVSFWYQQGGGPNWERMPIGTKRLPPSLYFEAEKPYYQQGATPEGIKIVTDYAWSGGAYVKFTPDKEKKYELQFILKRKNRYEVSLDMAKSPDMGAWRVSVDGKNSRLLTTLAVDNTSRETIDLGTLEFDAGKHRVVFDYIGPGEKGGKSLGVDGLYMRPLNFYSDDAE